ncbi:MAG: GntR family transcriptional regulator, partial [Granulosicoccaceae bacterium]
AEQALPSERELANALSVSRVTVRKAIQKLAAEGLLVQRQGAGTFVAHRLEQPLKNLTSFSEDIKSRNLHSGILWLDRSIGEASDVESKALKLPERAPVSRLYRLRTANEQALALELAVLPRALLPQPEQLNGSLYEYLDQQNNRPVRATQRLRAVACDAEQATFLRVEPGSPVLYIERHSTLADGSPVEFTRSYYRGDSYDFVSELAVEAPASTT